MMLFGVILLYVLTPILNKRKKEKEEKLVNLVFLYDIKQSADLQLIIVVIMLSRADGIWNIILKKYEKYDRYRIY